MHVCFVDTGPEINQEGGWLKFQDGSLYRTLPQQQNIKWSD